MTTGIICTDYEGNIQAVSNPEIWEEIYFTLKGSFANGRNIRDILFETDELRDERAKAKFIGGLEAIAKGERNFMCHRKGEYTIEVFFLKDCNQKKGQYVFLTDVIASSYLEDSDHINHLLTSIFVTAGLEIKGVLDECNGPKLEKDIEKIRGKAKTALREIRMGERLNYDIPMVRSLKAGKFVPSLNTIFLNSNIIEPIQDMFSKSYSERKISIKYDASLDEEVKLTADKAGMMFIMRAFFGIPVIVSRANEFRKFYASYGYNEPRIINGRNMHTVVYWVEWPKVLSEQEKKKILETSEYAIVRDDATKNIMPLVGLKYSRDIALAHGGDIEIEHRPYSRPRPETEFRLYLPVEMEKEKRLNIDSKN